MSLDYKIYQGKELIAATATVIGATHIGFATPQTVIKYAGRVVWNELKDGPITQQNRSRVDYTIQTRINHHRAQVAARYAALQAGSK